MDVNLYTGTGSSQTITNSGAMQPDFLWIKVRNTLGSHVQIDSVRGINKVLWSNQTAAEETAGAGTGVTSLNSNGFTLGTNTALTYGETNFSGNTYVAWQWRASNAAAVSNVAGTITSSVSANTTAGFSVLTYTGTGVNATVGHGLGVAPSMIFVKTRNITQNWIVYNSVLGKNQLLYLNSTDSAITNSDYWGTGGVTSTVFGLKGGGFSHNLASEPYVAYCFAPVAGYSAMGSYTGNGSTDGTFVYTGFRPRYVMIKRTDTTSDWYVYDSARNTSNVTDLQLFPNLSQAENQSGTGILDFTSNGFKLRGTFTGMNASGGTYIYMAFAESPFKNALAR
jgi:hypothetical protein